LILHGGTVLAVTGDAMTRTAEITSFLQQGFFLNALKSSVRRRSTLRPAIQRMARQTLTAGTVLLQKFLIKTGENNDELFGGIEVFQPIRPNRTT
jgi:hypothetical protein